MQRSIKVGLVASFLLLFTTNIVLIDLFLVMGRRSVQQVPMAAAIVRVSPTPTSVETCPTACGIAIDALDRKVTRLETRGASESQTLVSSTSNNAKEYYIPLGTGNTKSNIWQDLPGVEAVINTENYPSIKSVTFEAYLKIPTANGRVFVKLYNVTDKHDVWFSEISSEGPILMKKEAVITLERGTKTYRVMGLSTLSYDANIENARLRIVTN
ncbi:hypothetical protein HY949_04215 [Candidatus Gottesmanbacteria bacterium]|nr:hypothetical protein [Candidatus Gottesmanbacteria bacterium]